jgi:hypothetical protein
LDLRHTFPSEKEWTLIARELRQNLMVKTEAHCDRSWYLAQDEPMMTSLPPVYLSLSG